MFLEDSTIEVFAVLMVEVFAWRKVSVTTSFIYVCIFIIYGRVIHITVFIVYKLLFVHGLQV